jgi:hypothetical protein
MSRNTLPDCAVAAVVDVHRQAPSPLSIVNPSTVQAGTTLEESIR